MYSAGGQKTTCESKFEVEACRKIEESESSKQKINIHSFETEEQIKSLNNKIPQNEKSINRLEVQLDEILIECERTAATISEKRGSNFEKVLHEWKVKAEDLALELEAVRSEAAKEDSIDQLNIAGMVSVKYYWVLQMFFVIIKYFYSVQGEQKHDCRGQAHAGPARKWRPLHPLAGPAEAPSGGRSAIEQKENSVLHVQLLLAQTK